MHFRCPMLIKSRYTCTWFYYDTMIVTVNGFEMLLRYWTSGFKKYCTSAVYTSYFPVPPPSYCTLHSSITLMQGKSYMPTTMPLFHLQRPTLTPNFFILVFNCQPTKMLRLWDYFSSDCAHGSGSWWREFFLTWHLCVYITYLMCPHGVLMKKESFLTGLSTL